MLIEQPGAWGPDALFESDFPTEEARRLLRKTAALGIRVLLIRRRTKEDRAPIAFLAHSGDGARAPAIVAGSVSDPISLGDLDLEGFAQGRLPDFGRPVDQSVYLVCTHGRHDICCADKGRPLFRAMSKLRPDQTWETSHIGGDRFAGNLVVLPRGDYFGRLEPDDAGILVDEYEAQRLDLAHHRGRSIQPRMVQAAEQYLRESESLTGFDDLKLVDYTRSDPHHAEVVFRSSKNIDHRVRIAARDLPQPVFLTCRAGEPGQPVAYDLLAIESG